MIPGVIKTSGVTTVPGVIEVVSNRRLVLHAGGAGGPASRHAGLNFRLQVA